MRPLLSVITALTLAGCGTTGTASTPTDCVAAIADARKIAATTATAFDASSQYPPLIPRAAVAGSTNDTAELDRISRRMKTLTRRVERASARVAAQAEAFNAHAAGCEND